MRGLRQWVLLAMGAVALACVGLALGAALHVEPAAAFTAWQHNGATGCVCHDNGPPTDATCSACHTDFQSVPGQTCWSCHSPGQDTTSLSTPSSACTQQCHLYSSIDKAYTIPFQHPAQPHVGATANCLSCHQTSPTVDNPGGSPHHNGQPSGFTDCGACHTTYKKHVKQVDCTTCHATASSFHLYQAATPGFRNCRSCHARRHAGKAVPQSTCAGCHKGTGSGGATRAQHSGSVTKKRVCGLCHSKKLHASSQGGHLTCSTCHRSKYHGAQTLPPKTICLSCHPTAAHHSDGFSCVICHRSKIHNPRPHA